MFLLVTGTWIQIMTGPKLHPLPINIVSVTNTIVDSSFTILSTGGLCCIWVMFWFVLARDSPEDHPRITQAEKNYIVKNIEFDTTKRVILYCLNINYRQRFSSVRCK